MFRRIAKLLWPNARCHRPYRKRQLAGAALGYAPNELKDVQVVTQGPVPHLSPEIRSAPDRARTSPTPRGPEASGHAEGRLAAGQQIGRFEITGHLGGGGMGIVYKAQDTRLGRAVALKLLPRQMVGSGAAAARFLHEARAISALDHRAICTLHSIEESADGQTFLVMAYYDGETLARRLDRNGPLEVDEALAVAHEMGLGLSRAHECGIVHRDVKPANVMITSRGEVKLLDFGLAKSGLGWNANEVGTVVGTAAYMSPEQASGQAVDHRSDIWALGVVLFEMLSGKLPFRGASPMPLLRAVIHDPAISLESLRPDLPAGLCKLVRTALAKDPAARFQTMREMLRYIEREMSPGPSPASQVLRQVSVARPSVMVLAFADLSPDRSGAVFADGLTDELITNLSNIEALRVLSRSSSSLLRDNQGDPIALARELGIRYLLEGTVRRQGEELRVSAKLLAAADGALTWAGRFGGNLDDFFGIQESIARQIVAALQVTLSERENELLGEAPVSDVFVYECYLRARQEMMRYTGDALDRALDFVQRGLALAPENPLLLAAEGSIYWHYVNAGVSADDSYLQQAAERADRLLKVAPRSALGYRLTGQLAIHGGKIEQAISYLEHALALDPNDVETVGWLCSVLAVAGKPASSAPLLARLLELDPLTPIHHALPGVIALFAGDWRGAVAPLAAGYRMEPGNVIIRFVYGLSLALDQRVAEAVKVWDGMPEDPPNVFTALGGFIGHALRFDPDSAHAALTPELRIAALGDPQYAWHVAQGCALLGEVEPAIDALERAVERGLLNYPLLADLDPYLEPLRGLKRFSALLAKIEPRWKELVQ